MELSFIDRNDAGEKLALVVGPIIKGREKEFVLLALPRGGVPIASKISEKTKIPYDILVVRKIGHPHNEEFGIGAITEDESYWINPLYTRVNSDIDSMIQKTIEKEKIELHRRVNLYRSNRKLPDLKNKKVILIDDGLATGVTAKVGCDYLKSLGATQVILAVPVCSAQTASEFRRRGIDVVTVSESTKFLAVAQYYLNFDQVEDKEVLKLLEECKHVFREQSL